MEPRKPFFMSKRRPQAEERPQTPLPFFNRTSLQSRATAATASGSGSGSALGSNTGGSSPPEGSFASPNGAYRQPLNQNLASIGGSNTPTPEQSGLARFSTPQLEDQPEGDAQTQPRQHYSRLSEVPHKPDVVASSSELASPQTQSRMELAMASQKISSLKQALAMFPDEFEKSRSALASSNQRFGDHVAQCQAEISHLNAELNSAITKNTRLVDLKEAHEKEINKLRGVLEVTNSSLSNLKAGHSSFKDAFEELKKRHDEDAASLRELKKEVEATRKDAKAGISAVILAFDPGNLTAKSTATRETLTELQKDLASSQQVTDMLRNKLHIQASQLAETQTLVRGLQDENRRLRQDLDTRSMYDHLVEVEHKVSLVAGRLAQREEETFDTVVNLSSVQVHLEDSKNQIMTLKEALLTCQAERDELKEHTDARLLKVEELRTQLTLLQESKEDTKALVTELKNRLNEKEHAVLEKEANLDGLIVEKGQLQAQLVMATNAENKALSNIESLSKQYQASQDAFTSLQQQHSQLEERLETQSIALFKAKEENSLIKEKLLAEAAKVASLQERITSIATERNTIVNAVESRCAAMERTWAADQKALSNSDRRISDLESLVEHLRQENQHLRDSQKTATLAQATKMDERLLEAQRLNEVLIEENRCLQRRVQGIQERYQTNTLSNEEKLFVEQVMRDAQAIHEEDMVRKGQEIRLRDINIKELKAKTRELENTLARYIKEVNQSSDVNDRSVVGLKALFPSSSNSGSEPLFPAGEETFVEHKMRPSASKKREHRVKQDQDEDRASETSSLTSFGSHASVSGGKKRVRSATPFDEPPAKTKRRIAKGASPLPAAVPANTKKSSNPNASRLPHSASPPDAATIAALLPKKKAGRRRK